MIYFDNAATSWPKPPEVKEAVAAAIDAFGNASRSAHGLGLAASRSVEAARLLAAGLFGCSDPARVAFTKNATEALNVAVASVDGHLVATETAHNSLLRPLRRRGNYSIVPVDDSGRHKVWDVMAHCRPDTGAVFLTHASNVTGVVEPLGDIGALCRERGILLVVDAAQTAGLVDIDMAAMPIDAVCFTGHKSLYGVQGTGGICLGERFRARPLMVGGSGGRSFEPEQPPEPPALLEAGTTNAHGIAGLAAGMEYVLGHTPRALLERGNALAARFLRGLENIPGVRLYGDYGAPERVPVVSLNVGGLDSAEVAAELEDGYGIAVRAGAHCAPLLHRRFGTERQGAVRFSFSHRNTEEEIDTALKALAEIAASS